MSKTSKVGGVLVTAAVAFAVYKYMKLDKEEKDELCDKIKDKANHFMTNSSEILDKVQNYVSELKEKEEDEILDKIVIMKNMLFDIFGSKKQTIQDYKEDLESGIN